MYLNLSLSCAKDEKEATIDKGNPDDEILIVFIRMLIESIEIFLIGSYVYSTIGLSYHCITSPKAMFIVV